MKLGNARASTGSDTLKPKLRVPTKLPLCHIYLSQATFARDETNVVQTESSFTITTRIQWLSFMKSHLQDKGGASEED